eukprot:3696665-Pyramimonas_sp.AAC.1
MTTYQTTPTQPEDPNFGLDGGYTGSMLIFSRTFPDPPPTTGDARQIETFGLGWGVVCGGWWAKVPRTSLGARSAYSRGPEEGT